MKIADFLRAPQLLTTRFIQIYFLISSKLLVCHQNRALMGSQSNFTILEEERELNLDEIGGSFIKFLTSLSTKSLRF